MMVTRFAMLASVAFVGLASPTLAQDAAPQPSDIQSTEAPPEADAGSEIIVTAQRTEQSVQDVPIPVTVVSGDQLRNQSVQEISDLGRTAASLRLAENPGGTGGGGYIRGIGTFARSRAAEPSVGIVVDGVVQGLTNIRNLSDVQRVEVLRGPQGTLFGQSVSAGVINITTKAPRPGEFSGEVSTELSFDDTAGSNFGKQQVRGAVNVPLGGEAAVRVSGYRVGTQGILENIFQGNDDYRKEWGVRGRFLANLTDAITVNLIAEYNNEDRGNGYFLTIRDLGGVRLDNTQFNEYPSSTGTGTIRLVKPSAAVFDPTVATATTRARVLYCGLQPSIDNFEICSDAPALQTYKTQGYSGQLDFALPGGFDLSTITSFRKLDVVTQNDIDNLPEAIDVISVHSGLTTVTDQLTQEIRLQSDAKMPVSFTVGAFYIKTNVDSVAGPAAGAYTRVYTQKAARPITDCFPTATVPQCSVFITPGAFNNFQHFDAENMSAFGEVRYDGGVFAAFAGARYNHSILGQNSLTVNLANNSQRTLNLTVVDNDISYRAGVEFEPNRDLLVYATLARGYKNGQITPLQNNDNPTILNPEKPTNYEVGVKSSMLGGRLLANLSGFYSRVKGYQTSRCAVDATFATTCTPFNIDRVTSKGVEADVFGRIGDHLKLNFNAIYNIVRYPVGFAAQDGSDLSRQQLADAPKFGAAFYADYEVPVSDGINLVLGGDVAYKGKLRLSDLSASDYYIYKSHALVGARVGLQSEDAGWRIALFAKNLFNQNSPQQFATLVNQDGSQRPFQVQGVLNGQTGLRQVGLQASFEW